MVSSLHYVFTEHCTVLEGVSDRVKQAQSLFLMPQLNALYMYIRLCCNTCMFNVGQHLITEFYWKRYCISFIMCRKHNYKAKFQKEYMKCAVLYISSCTTSTKISQVVYIYAVKLACAGEASSYAACEFKTSYVKSQKKSKSCR